jgi:hypothetical protein
MRLKRTFRLPPGLANRLADYASRKRVPQTLLVKAALALVRIHHGAKKGGFSPHAEHVNEGTRCSAIARAPAH